MICLELCCVVISKQRRNRTQKHFDHLISKLLVRSMMMQLRAKVSLALAMLSMSLMMDSIVELEHD